jgi:hypothetical protein
MIGGEKYIQEVKILIEQDYVLTNIVRNVYKLFTNTDTSLAKEFKMPPPPAHHNFPAPSSGSATLCNLL